MEAARNSVQATSPPPGTGAPAALRAHAGSQATSPGGLTGPAPRLSFTLVVVALVLLLVVPILVRERSDAIRRTAADLAEPARDLAEDVERDFAVQLAAGGRRLPGEAARGSAGGPASPPQDAARFAAAGADAQRALDRLEPLARALGPQVSAAVDSLRAALEAWERGESPDPTLAAASRLDAAIGQAVQRRREEAARTDLAAAVLTAVLVVLVLASVILLARLAGQLRRLAEEAARRAAEEASLREELERTMESRARLIRGFSHDVRNPLGAADGYAQLLGTHVYGPLNARQEESLGRLRRSIGTALLLVDDLLDLARLEAGQLQMAWERVELRALVEDLAEEYRAQAEGAEHTLALELPPGEVEVQSDARRLRQVLGNLLSNAIKYTPPGGRLTLRLTERTDGAGAPRPGRWAAIEVADTGLGIAPEQQARIFDEFARLEPGTARGAGLGLTISLRLARALGGDIGLESAPGQGSTFTLWVPAQAPA